MNELNQSTGTVPSEAAGTAKSLRKLYFARVAFSVIWITLVVTVGKTNNMLEEILFVLYPIWDIIATFVDINANPAASNKIPQYVNVAIGTLTTIAVIIALQSGIPTALVVFGVWASLTGLIQFIIGLRRRRMFEGQWPMILSGAQSLIAGSFIILRAHMPNYGIASLAGYSAFGAFYFALAAIRLGKTTKNTNV